MCTFRSILFALLFVLGVSANAGVTPASVDRVVSGRSEFPIAVVPEKVGTYPGMVKSGAGHFYDDVLEYRVWLAPERGAERKNGGSDYFVAFAQYERALAFSKEAKGAEEPLALIRQMKHVNEPRPGVYEVVSGERLTEWKVTRLAGKKRVPGAIEKFMIEHKR